ncbi:hypothetical protein B0T21DRAFT_362308 [Apiosordaria backusii]|uniref:Uncharacterized protein n=1 Tax=Apiosordaria backusii TaxID=314023 RepID=A0AA40EHN8_9PEZI|nr:hypothetical protein B0T21DRAFT_362308 [Apiosordaria backusii]
MLPLILVFASLSQAQDNTPLPLPSATSTTSITVPWSSIPAPSGTGTVWSSTSAPTSAPAASGGGGNAGLGAVCGRGFTYCGYILRDHQGIFSSSAPSLLVSQLFVFLMPLPHSRPLNTHLPTTRPSVGHLSPYCLPTHP